jgi:DnaK suppressor protein
MTQTELDKFRTILSDKHAELSQTLRRRDGIAIERTPDALDETRQSTERELTTRSLERESKLMRDVRAAVARIDAGSYGTCLDCEEDISPKRLRAVPWATLCIGCQEAADRSRVLEFPSREDFFAKAA